jgi:hypothetical protein
MIRRLVALCIVLLIVSGRLTAAEPKDLFNGTDLTGWEGNQDVWSVEDGAIVGRTTAETPIRNNTFLIWQGGDVRDFRLTFEYRIEGERANSGVQYRSRVVDPAKWVVGGYQADIDATNRYTGILYDERGERAIMAERGERATWSADKKKSATRFADAAELAKVIRNNEWNEYVIEARGPNFRHTINGELMSETTDNDEARRAESGILALQLHTGPPMVIKFRNLRYEVLDGEAAK